MDWIRFVKSNIKTKIVLFEMPSNFLALSR